MNYKATLASDKDASYLINALLSTTFKGIEFEKETHNRVGIYVHVNAFKKIGIENVYLSASLYDVDIERILEKIAPTCIIDGDRSQTMDYTNYSFDDLIEAAKNESDFIKHIEEWDINCEN